jgi:2',3'-cyclic-nucleotide 2'-phosphodiesterase (5'-nucleotidase family)
MSVQTSGINVVEETKDMDDATKSSTVWLRIIQINDVYELQNFPSFKALVDEKSQGPDKTLVVLSGDFLGPSLLSSLDKGRGMVDTMMACGITHVCFGNHVRCCVVLLCCCC